MTSEIIRTIVALDKKPTGHIATYDCGHIATLNQIYDNRIGDKGRCFPCNHGGKDVWGNEAKTARRKK